MPASLSAITLPAASPDLVETGFPNFSISGIEQIGLATGPQALRLMPDGRILLVAGRQLALGDGVRWEIFAMAADQAEPAEMGVQVDGDGTIYLASLEGIGKVQFAEAGTWRLAPLARWPATPAPAPQGAPEGVRPWIWHTLTGNIYAWRPGEEPRLLASADTIECTFWHQGALMISERGEGMLRRLAGPSSEVVRAEGSFSAITCVLPLGPDRLLAGTYGLGLRLLVGNELRPFSPDSLFASGARINDLCAADDDHLVVAVDNLGLALLDHEGRVSQLLDTRADRRLARVRQLLRAPNGEIWALVDGGVLRLEHPAPLSRYEPLLSAGVTTVHPYRIGGRLWFLSNGRIYRGKYNGVDRLESLELDSPPGSFVNSLATLDDLAVAGTEGGGYYRGTDGWVAFAPGVKNFRLISSRAEAGRWLYVARDEVGWLEAGPGGLRMTGKLSVPGLSNVYNRPVPDAGGRIWLELGSGRVAMVAVAAGRPQVTLFGPADGLPQSWPQLFELNGVAAFDFNGAIYFYDASSRRILPADQGANELPPAGNIFGRPGYDAAGRLWLVGDNRLQLWQREAGRWRQLDPGINPGFLPYYFVFEPDGVVWMHAQQRFARYAPHEQAKVVAVPRAIITRVQLGRTQHFGAGLAGELPPVPFGDNDLQAHFVASATTLATPVGFEAKLEGSGRDWIEVGSAGTIRFEQLREGHYRLRIRPKVAGQTGEEASLGFTVRPPWHRTGLAYAAFCFGAVALAGLAAWLLVWWHRRDRLRLEDLVRERTLELQRSNQQLGWRLNEIRLLSEALEQSPVAVFLTRPDDVIEYANASAAALTGCAPAALAGRTLRSLREGATAAPVLEEIAAARVRGAAWNGQLANRHANGQVVQVRSSSTPLRGPEGRLEHLVVLEEDITARLAEEERRRRLEDQLLQSQKMETIGQLAGGVAHDLNNMLQAISGFATIAQQPGISPRERDDALQEVMDASRRATEVTRQLLLFSRQQQAELRAVNLGELVTNLLRLLRRLIGEHIAIEFAAPGAAHFAWCDPTQIEQVLINLCVNARDAMPGGGAIHLALDRRVLDEEFAGTNPWARAGDFIEIRVRDTGHGMEPAVMDRIFEPFFSTKPKDKGTGLGLSVVYGIVIQHKGLIQVRSQPGQGTEFQICLPASPAAEATPATPVAAAPAVGSETILIAEDDPSVRSLADRVLRRAGYRVLLATNGEEAIETFLRHREEIALLIFDCVMPRTGGLEAYLRLGTTRPVIFCTGYSEEIILTGGALPPNSRVLQKPYEIPVLLATVRQVLDSAVPR